MKDQTTIAIISTYLEEESGAEKSLKDLICNLNKTKFKIYKLYNETRSNSEKESDILKNKLIWFSYSYNPILILSYFFNIIFFSIHFHSLKLRPNIVLSNTIKAHLYTLFLMKFQKTRFILCHRDSIHSNLLIKILLKRTDKIICVSHFISEKIKVSPDKKKVIYPGIDIKFWSRLNAKNEEITNYCLKGDYLKVACVGQITKWKNHIDFIKSAQIILRDHKNVYFFLIGDDLSGKEGELKNNLVRTVNELRIDSNFFFLGYKKDIKDLLSEIDILVHTAIDEPFGRVLIEAMAMEMPVVAYNSGGPKEIVIDNKTGFLIEPYNFEQLALKTIELIMDNNLRLNMGKEGRQRVIEKFNIERYVQEMEEAFESM